LVLALRFSLWLIVAVTAWRLGGERAAAVAHRHGLAA
jgi:hypothetical protein